MREDLTMMVVIEGPDGSGKSTLANDLLTQLSQDGLKISLKLTEGPEKKPGEIISRINRYNVDYEHSPCHIIIYDRHPVVSQNIYSSLDEKRATVSYQNAKYFLYDKKPYIIYCRDTRFSLDNQVQEWDTTEFKTLILENKSQLKALYDKWALEYANMIYRISDPIDSITELLKWRYNHHVND